MTELSITNINVQESVYSVTYNSQKVQILSGAGIIDLNVPITSVPQIGSPYTVVLPDPQYIGQIKTIMVGSHQSEGYSPITINYNWSYYEDITNVSSLNLEYLGDNQVFIGASIGWSPYNYIY